MTAQRIPTPPGPTGPRPSVMSRPLDLDEIALQTLNLLAWRLRRLEFVMNGMQATPHEQVAEQSSVQVRMHKLEQSLQRLSSRHESVAGILRLHQAQPHILSPEESSDGADQKPTSTQALTITLAAAPSYHAIASQLRALADLPPPPTTSFVKLIALGPRIEAAAQQQALQEQEVAELRKRSARVVVRWHEISVKAQMRCWVDWEARVRRAEREVRRREQRDDT